MRQGHLGWTSVLIQRHEALLAHITRPQLMDGTKPWISTVAGHRLNISLYKGALGEIRLLQSCYNAFVFTAHVIAFGKFVNSMDDGLLNPIVESNTLQRRATPFRGEQHPSEESSDAFKPEVLPHLGYSPLFCRGSPNSAAQCPPDSSNKKVKLTCRAEEV
ncbi:hypothetical protein EYF80_009350 [Liparis tanakae]|uniref:Uncharacterized protein n=1 Tax=Liparis tanakae TaxID=230148 RepID=A0A4Z2IR54_9TELE|nr:hypothetical protein EYF80_009350 [Liparis tanakae]